MSNPPKGSADYWAPGDWNTICFFCGSKFKASELKKHWQGFYVCASCWEPRHPQDFVRGIPDKPGVPWSQPGSDLLIGPGLFIATEDDIAIFTEDLKGITIE